MAITAGWSISSTPAPSPTGSATPCGPEHADTAMRASARSTIVNRYDLHGVCLPAQLAMLQKLTGTRGLAACSGHRTGEGVMPPLVGRQAKRSRPVAKGPRASWRAYSAVPMTRRCAGQAHRRIDPRRNYGAAAGAPPAACFVDCAIRVRGRRHSGSAGWLLHDDAGHGPGDRARQPVRPPGHAGPSAAGGRPGRGRAGGQARRHREPQCRLRLCRLRRDRRAGARRHVVVSGTDPRRRNRQAGAVRLPAGTGAAAGCRGDAGAHRGGRLRSFRSLCPRPRAGRHTVLEQDAPASARSGGGLPWRAAHRRPGFGDRAAVWADRLSPPSDRALLERSGVPRRRRHCRSHLCPRRPGAGRCVAPTCPGRARDLRRDRSACCSSAAISAMPRRTTRGRPWRMAPCCCC